MIIKLSQLLEQIQKEFEIKEDLFPAGTELKELEKPTKNKNRKKLEIK